MKKLRFLLIVSKKMLGKNGSDPTKVPTLNTAVIACCRENAVFETHRKYIDNKIVIKVAIDWR